MQVSTPPAGPDAPEPDPSTPSRPSERRASCTTPAEDAARRMHDEVARRNPDVPPDRIGVEVDHFSPVEESYDLDDDGSPDVVLRHLGGRNTEHFVYQVKDGCGRFVGGFLASTLFPPACLHTKTNGLCDLGVSRLMIHGETEHSTYKFDGKEYVLFGTPELTPRRP